MLQPFCGVHIQGETAIDGKGETDAIMVPELRGQKLAIHTLDVKIPNGRIRIPLVRPDPCQDIIPDFFEIIPYFVDTVVIPGIADMIQENKSSLTFFNRVISFLITEGEPVAFQNQGRVPKTVDAGKDLINFKAVKMVVGVIMLNLAVFYRYSFEVIHQG